MSDTPRGSLMRRLLAPRVFFPAMFALVVLSVLLAPEPVGDDGVEGSTYSTRARGASAFMSTAQRLGWQVSRWESSPSDSLPEGAVIAVLAGSRRVTVAETHALLDRVRAGAGLIVVANGGALSDSLHLQASTRSGAILPAPGDSGVCPRSSRAFRTPTAILLSEIPALTFTAAMRPDTVHLASLTMSTRVSVRASSPGDSSRRPSPVGAIGIPFGRGRIAVIGSAGLVANDFIRTCALYGGVTAIRILEWVSDRPDSSRRNAIVFDEFHFGAGQHAAVLPAIEHWLIATPSGRMTFVCALASLILLAASGARTLVPRPRHIIPRRSPIEHVAALAQAYEQAHGTRTATRLLVQGLRRRLGRMGGRAHIADTDILATLEARHPELHDDAETVRSAMTTRVTPARLLDIAHTIDRLERSVRT